MTTQINQFFDNIPMVSWTDLAAQSGAKITQSDVVAIRWLGCLSSRIRSYESMVDWELRQVPEVAGEFFNPQTGTHLGKWPGSVGLLVNQEFTSLRKAWYTDCYSELVDNWYEYEDNPLPVPRLMPSAMNEEDEGFNKLYWPGWYHAGDVYNEIPYEERKVRCGHTEGFFSKPSYCGVVVICDHDGSLGPYFEPEMLKVIQMLLDEDYPLYKVRSVETYDENPSSDLLV